MRPGSADTKCQSAEECQSKLRRETKLGANYTDAKVYFADFLLEHPMNISASEDRQCIAMKPTGEDHEENFQLISVDCNTKRPYYCYTIACSSKRTNLKLIILTIRLMFSLPSHSLQETGLLFIEHDNNSHYGASQRSL